MEPPSKLAIAICATTLLVFGAALIAVFSDPLVRPLLECSWLPASFDISRYSIVGYCMRLELGTDLAFLLLLFSLSAFLPR